MVVMLVKTGSTRDVFFLDGEGRSSQHEVDVGDCPVRSSPTMLGKNERDNQHLVPYIENMYKVLRPRCREKRGARDSLMHPELRGRGT